MPNFEIGGGQYGAGLAYMQMLAQARRDALAREQMAQEAWLRQRQMEQAQANFEAQARREAIRDAATQNFQAQEQAWRANNSALDRQQALELAGKEQAWHSRENALARQQALQIEDARRKAEEERTKRQERKDAEHALTEGLNGQIAAMQVAIANAHETDVPGLQARLGELVRQRSALQGVPMVGEAQMPAQTVVGPETAGEFGGRLAAAGYAPEQESAAANRRAAIEHDRERRDAERMRQLQFDAAERQRLAGEIGRVEKALTYADSDEKERLGEALTDLHAKYASVGGTTSSIPLVAGIEARQRQKESKQQTILARAKAFAASKLPTRAEADGILAAADELAEPEFSAQIQQFVGNGLAKNPRESQSMKLEEAMRPFTTPREKLDYLESERSQVASWTAQAADRRLLPQEQARANTELRTKMGGMSSSAYLALLDEKERAIRKEAPDETEPRLRAAAVAVEAQEGPKGINQISYNRELPKSDPLYDVVERGLEGRARKALEALVRNQLDSIMERERRKGNDPMIGSRPGGELGTQYYVVSWPHDSLTPIQIFPDEGGGQTEGRAGARPSGRPLPTLEEMKRRLRGAKIRELRGAKVP